MSDKRFQQMAAVSRQARVQAARAAAQLKREERMSRMIAYCGLVCSECPTFLATRADDDAARARTATLYAEKFGFDLRPEEINCDGCRSEGGTLMAYCRACAIRECCRTRGFGDCTVCPDEPCENLAEFHAFSPGAKASFEALRGRSDGS